MPNIHVSAGVAVQFPTSLFDVIQKHGEGKTYNHFRYLSFLISPLVDGPSLLAEGNSSNDFSKAGLILLIIVYAATYSIDRADYHTGGLWST